MRTSDATAPPRPAGAPAAAYRGSPGGIGQSGSLAGEALSDDLGHHAEPFLDDRRTAARLALTAIGALGSVARYQYGLVRHLPEPPGRIYAGYGGYLTAEGRHRRHCSCCLLAAASRSAMLPRVTPEAGAALRLLTSRVPWRRDAHR